jgi:hypothetical protein
MLNEVWLELIMLARFDRLDPDPAPLGRAATAEPKRLRYRLPHVADRLAKLHLQHIWPRATELAAVFARLKALPAATG